jgi:hypothetical protein
MSIGLGALHGALKHWEETWDWVHYMGHWGHIVSRIVSGTVEIKYPRKWIMRYECSIVLYL